MTKIDFLIIYCVFMTILQVYAGFKQKDKLKLGTAVPDYWQDIEEFILSTNWFVKNGFWGLQKFPWLLFLTSPLAGIMFWVFIFESDKTQYHKDPRYPRKYGDSDYESAGGGFVRRKQ